MSNEKIIEALDKFEWHIDFMDETRGSTHGPINPDWQLLEDARDELAALAPPAPHIVDTVEGFTNGSVVLDRHGDVWQQQGGEWCSYDMEPTSMAHHRLFAPFTVLHVGGAE